MTDEFSADQESKRRLGLLSAEYAIYSGSVYLVTNSSGETAEKMAIIALIAAMLSHKKASKIPLFFGRLLARGLMARGTTKPSERLERITQQICAENNIPFDEIKLFSFTKGVTKNAFALGNEVYIGKEIEDMLSDDELAYVVAHELTHVVNTDARRAYLSQAPYFYSMVATYVSAPALLLVSVLSDEPVDNSMLTSAALLSSYFLQKPLRGAYSRSVERVADHGALEKTGNKLMPAVTALLKITGFEGEQTTWQKLGATHPVGVGRIEALLAAHRSILPESQQETQETLMVETIINALKNAEAGLDEEAAIEETGVPISNKRTPSSL